MRLLNDMFVVTNETAEQVDIRLNAGHYIYQAHFPGNPVTPGVCIVQMIVELLKKRVGEAFSLTRITNLKFVSVISPIENPEVTVRFLSLQTNEGECKFKGQLEAKGKIMTKISLVLNKRD